jgi:hypothetical protein
MDLRPFHRFDGSRGLPIGTGADQLYERQQLEHARQSRVEYSTHVIEVDSALRDRVNFPNSNDFMVYFRAPLTNIVRVDLSFAEVPNTGFNVNESNSLFVLEEVVGSNAPNVVRFTLDEGFYDINDLSDELTRLLNLHSSSTQKPYTVSSLTRQNKLSFTAGADVSQFRILFEEATCGKVLGFENINTDFSTGGIVSSKYVDTTGERYVLLSSPELDTNLHEITYSDGVTVVSPTNCFGRIALVGEAGSLVTYSGGIGGYPIFKEFRPPIARLDSLHIRWLKRDGTPADFRNLENNIQLHFKCVVRSLGTPNFPGYF